MQLPECCFILRNCDRNRYAVLVVAILGPMPMQTSPKVAPG